MYSVCFLSRAFWKKAGNFPKMPGFVLKRLKLGNLVLILAKIPGFFENGRFFPLTLRTLGVVYVGGRIGPRAP